jgi:hypothetical protein
MRFLVVVITLGFLVGSCKKAENLCQGSCADLHLKGQCIDLSSGTGIAGVKVSVYWFYRGFSFFHTGKIIGEALTDKDGYFNFIVFADTSQFGKNNLTIQVDIPDGYLGPNYVHEKILRKWFSTYNSIQPGINFFFYRKANLSIKLKRTLNDNFLNFRGYYSYGHATGSNLFDVNGLFSSPDTTFNVVTAANRYTLVETSKYLSPGNFVYTGDSVYCTAGNNNTITVNY